MASKKKEVHEEIVASQKALKLVGAGCVSESNIDVTCTISCLYANNIVSVRSDSHNSGVCVCVCMYSGCIMAQ